MKCQECGREGELVSLDENSGDEWKHKDGRVKHPFRPQEEQMPRTRVVSPTGDEEYTAVLNPEDPEDASLMEQAETIFGDLDEDEDYDDGMTLVAGQLYDKETGELVDDEPPPDDKKRNTKPNPSEISEESPVSVTNPLFGRPKKEDMVTVRGGGLYLTARRRISWMRGEPQPQPLWTIDTYPEEIERGKFISNNKVEGGYARYRANVFDEDGRLVGTGTKTEWSERFMDFAEKAETGAIARALAVCGFGTEAALDLDEGYEQDRIADAPVSDSRPINITPSNVGGLAQGGRSENVTQAQINEIQRLIKLSAMGLTIVPFMENVLERSVPPLGEDPGLVITEFLEGLSFTEASQLIQALNKAAFSAQ